eukprot:11104782-Alexandrium_andersonii.AAC.1
MCQLPVCDDEGLEGSLPRLSKFGGSYVLNGRSTRSRGPVGGPASRSSTGIDAAAHSFLAPSCLPARGHYCCQRN